MTWVAKQISANSDGWGVYEVTTGERFRSELRIDKPHGQFAKTDALKIAAAPELLAALRDWLGFAEETLSEFDVEPCDAETLCPKCQPAGCINLKMQLARAAIAKAEGRS